MNETAEKILEMDDLGLPKANVGGLRAIATLLRDPDYKPNEKEVEAWADAIDDASDRMQLAVQLAKDSLAKESTQEPSGLVERLRSVTSDTGKSIVYAGHRYWRLSLQNLRDFDAAADAIESRDAALKAAGERVPYRAMRVDVERECWIAVYGPRAAVLYDDGPYAESWVSSEIPKYFKRLAALKGGNDGL